MKFFSKVFSAFLFVIAASQIGAGTVQAVDKVTADPTLVTINENGGSAIIELSLSEPIVVGPGSMELVEIFITSPDDRIEVSPMPVSFLGDEWMQVKEFTITGVDDLILNPDNEVTLTLEANSESEFYNAYQFEVTVTLVDDEADVTSPDTFFVSSYTSSSVAIFEFSSNEEPSTFECNLDGGGFVPCTSPYTTAALLNGEHTFEVRAVDAFLNTDLSPASESWTVLEPIDIWHLNATSGDFAIDSWESDNDGIVTGTPNWTTGRVGNALLFDGATNYITVDRPVQDDFTICAWIKTDKPGIDFPDHWRLAPIMESEVGALGNDFGFGVDVNGYLAYGNGGEFDATVSGITSVIDNEWHHACVTRNTITGAAILYVNGLEDAVGATDTATLDANASAYIGNAFDGGVYFEGLIDEIFVYNSVLSADQILSLYEDTLPAVLSVSPADGEVEVNIDVSIVITFIEPIATESLVISTSPCTDGDACATYDTEWSEGNTVLTLMKSNGSFDAGTTYTISLAAQDETGNEMAEEYEWSFTTRGVSTSTSSGSLSKRGLELRAAKMSTSQSSVLATFPLTRLLKFKMVGEDVRMLQQFLNKKGFPLAVTGPGAPGFETSLFGPKTLAMVKKFQLANGLTPDGIVGPLTWGMLTK